VLTADWADDLARCDGMTTVVDAAAATGTGGGPAGRSGKRSPPHIESPLRHLDPAAISATVRAESRNREVRLPPVSTYRWWARRTEAVNGAIIDAVEQDRPGRMVVADPMAGGGVIPLAAVMRGHRVYGQDLNPWAVAGLRAMLGLPNPVGLREAAAVLAQRVQPDVDAAYGTTLSDGTIGQVSHTMRVATAACTDCGERARLFPHALVSLLTRRERRQPAAYLACSQGHLYNGNSDAASTCPQCGEGTDPVAAYTARRLVTCRVCGRTESLQRRAEHGEWRWQIVLVERSRPGRRELAIPNVAEIAAAEHDRWHPARDLGDIPDGQETRVLLRHGFKRWEQLYPRRQHAFLERLLGIARGCSEDAAVVAAVEMAIIGSAEMAGHLSRWDRFYLKSYESMAGHRFNFTTFAVEPNVWGTVTSGRGTVLRRLGQLAKAADWLHRQTGRTLTVDGPLSTARRHSAWSSDIRVVEGSSERMLLTDRSVDLCLTDPPYHDDVQYSELSLPLRAWAGLADGALVGEAVVNDATGQLTDSGAYADLLTRIFQECRRVLSVDGHLIFTYANRRPEAWADLFYALQAAGLRAIGCEIVHSENETDHAKRGVRACTLDLILDLVPTGSEPVKQHAPTSSTEGAEAGFLRLVAARFLSIGRLEGGWREPFLASLRDSDFLRAG
jgi:putative DNA methylase